jgi:SAM-dependent methyltransferase
VADRREDRFAGTDYRRLIAWEDRLRREGPFLASIFATAPSRTLLDVGCGSGEHVRHFADAGFAAVGIDISESMIAQARELAGTFPSGGSARFEQRAAADAASLPDAPFGGAMCVGNALAFVEPDELGPFLRGVASALSPGAPFLLQTLNYERIEAVPVRALPVNVRPAPPEEGGEIVFLRVLAPRGDGVVDFYPITLSLKPGRDPLVEVRAAHERTHRAWKLPVLGAALADAGFADVRALGGMSDVPFRPLESPDLVLVARKPRKRG